MPAGEVVASEVRGKLKEIENICEDGDNVMLAFVFNVIGLP